MLLTPFPSYGPVFQSPSRSLYFPHHHPRALHHHSLLDDLMEDFLPTDSFFSPVSSPHSIAPTIRRGHSRIHSRSCNPNGCARPSTAPSQTRAANKLQATSSSLSPVPPSSPIKSPSRGSRSISSKSARRIIPIEGISSVNATSNAATSPIHEKKEKEEKSSRENSTISMKIDDEKTSSTESVSVSSKAASLLSKPSLSSLSPTRDSSSSPVPSTPRSAGTIEDEKNSDGWINLDKEDFVNYKERITPSPK